jgi:predicted nucleotidyltransferase
VSYLSTIQDKLHQIKPQLSEKYHVNSIGLFGSIVRNDFKPESDIDILVDFSQPIGHLNEVITPLSNLAATSPKQKKRTKWNILHLIRFRGFERIRTAVEGFADLCLATRPRNHLKITAF